LKTGRNSIELTKLAVSGLMMLALLISGCSMVGPDYVQPTPPEAETWLDSEEPKFETGKSDIGDWWTVFSDPVLDDLIEAAYQQNLTLQIAGLRIYEARAELGIAFGFQYPQIQEGFGSGSINQLSKNAPNQDSSIIDRYYADYDIGLGAAWELDVWGKFRRAVQTGVANLETSVADYDDILVSLTGEVARTYIFLRTSEERLVVARGNVATQKRSFEIASDRFKFGAVTKLDVLQARALLRTTESSIPRLQVDIRQAKNALAVLLGKLPGEIDAMLGGAGTIPEPPPEVAVGIPAELLRRRPDIRAAERQLAAQSAQIGFAKADLFPQFSLFGTLGFQTASFTDSRSNDSEFSDLFDKDSFFYSAGGGFRWDILHYGRITNRVRVQDARFQELAVNYDETVLEAAQEVEDSMVGFLRSQEAVVFLGDAVTASVESVELALMQYRAGEADYQRVLDTQRDLLRRQDDLVSTAGAVGQNLVGIYRALGGGWEIRAGQDFIPASLKEEMENRTNWGNILSPEKTETPPSEEVKSILHKPDW
jgi:NodT family efflux transporter outer membrane factor (OMF) lipoprotein